LILKVSCGNSVIKYLQQRLTETSKQLLLLIFQWFLFQSNLPYEGVLHPQHEICMCWEVFVEELYPTFWRGHSHIY